MIKLRLNNRKTIYRVLVLYAFSGFAANLAHPVTPQFLHSLQLPASMFGFAFAMMSFANFIISPFWGNLNDYVNSKTLLFFSSAGYGLGQFIFSKASTSAEVLLGRFVAGFFVSGVTVSSIYYIIQKSSDEKQGTYVTLAISLFSVLGTLGFFVGGSMGDKNLLAPFSLQWKLLIFLAVLYFLLLEKTQEEKRSIAIKDIFMKSNPLDSIKEVKTYINPSISLLFTIVFLAFAAGTTVTQSFTYYIQTDLGLSPKVNGNLKAIVGLSSMLINAFLTVKIVKSHEVEKHTSRLFTVMALIYMIIIFKAKNVQWVLLAGGSLMVFHNMQMAILQDRNAHYAPSGKEGSMVGMHNSLKSLGMIIGSSFAGILYDFNSLSPFILGASLYMLSSYLMLHLARHQC